MVYGDTECRIVANKGELLSEWRASAHTRMNPTCKLGLRDLGKGEL
jgi:hypothetical protein